MYQIRHFSSCDFVRHNVTEADGFRRLLNTCSIQWTKHTRYHNFTNYWRNQSVCLCNLYKFPVTSMYYTHLLYKVFNPVTSIAKHTPIHYEIVDTKFHPRKFMSLLLLEPTSLFPTHVIPANNRTTWNKLRQDCYFIY